MCDSVITLLVQSISSALIGSDLTQNNNIIFKKMNQFQLNKYNHSYFDFFTKSIACTWWRWIHSDSYVTPIVYLYYSVDSNQSGMF